MTYNKLNNILGWGIFVIAAYVYLSTIEPTTSLWDCGEYIATSFKLEVGHPPGAPFFMLMGRVFSALVQTTTETGNIVSDQAAMMINAMSALCSAFAIMFLFWSITALGRKLAEKVEEMDTGKMAAVFASGLIGAGSFIFSDTFWFSAVEGEVYAMSALFTATVFWLILKWDRVAEEKHSIRYIILISFIMGLSIGVHLMNILAIPAIVLLYYFRKYPATWKGAIGALAISGALIIVFQVVVITGIFEMAGAIERFFVNSLDLGFNTGTILYSLLLFGGVAYGLWYTQKTGRVVTNTILLALTVILIGYSSYAMVVIRSSNDPPMDENNPENLITLVSYLKREQYGSRPIFSGQYWNAPRKDQKVGSKIYMKAYVVKDANGRTLKEYAQDFKAKQYVKNSKKSGLSIDHEYIVKNTRQKFEYEDEMVVPFQRMYDRNHGKDYKKWIDPEKMVMTDVKDRRGKRLKKPAWWQNVQYYLDYQLGWMWGRYFMWNFAGRQNDMQGFANSVLKGNWLTGVDFIDKERLGNQKQISKHYTDKESYNRFFYLPLILGLIGFFYQLIRSPKNWAVVLVLFIITGIAIVTYLNQPPHEPRERDYTNVGSYYAFAIWIGLGVYALFDAARNMNWKSYGEVAKWGLGGSIGLALLRMAFGGNNALGYSLIYMSVIALLLFLVMIIAGRLLKGKVGHALVAFLICLPVPFVMAKDGWDDHSRAKRYTARDFAKDYLDSCDKNAILFTNGDNDTFPLWYVQEVEGYRTDVRVVNLSLLNTDWYINQMRRKAYDSEPVPFEMERSKYRQGTRDVCFVLNPNRKKVTANLKEDLISIARKHGKDAISIEKLENGKKRFYLDVERAVDFISKNKNKKDLFRNGERYAYFPSKFFKLDVNKQEVLESGAVDKDKSDQIVDEVRWKVGQTQIMKNQLMIMTLLANNDWNRPVYFSVTTGSGNYLGLKDYLQLEGLAYRFVPVKTENPNYPGRHGFLDTDRMYNNMMNKFSWGNMQDPDVYIDDYNMKMTSNMRLQFSNLAHALINEGKKDSAKKVLNRCLEVMPKYNVPYGRIMASIIKGYYQVGDTETANSLSKEVFKRYEDDLYFYNSLGSPYGSYGQVTNEKRMALFIMQRLTGLVKNHGPEELHKELQQKFQNLRQTSLQDQARPNM